MLILLKYLSEASNSHLARVQHNYLHILLSESSRIQIRKHSTQDILIKMKFIQIIFRDQDNLILRVPKGYITFDPDLIKIIKMNFVFHKSAQTWPQPLSMLIPIRGCTKLWVKWVSLYIQYDSWVIRSALTRIYRKIHKILPLVFKWNLVLFQKLLYISLVRSDCTLDWLPKGIKTIRRLLFRNISNSLSQVYQKSASF